MNLFKRIFKINAHKNVVEVIPEKVTEIISEKVTEIIPEEVIEIIPEKEKVTVGASTFNKTILIEKREILVESQIPAYCNIGNLNYEKKYHESIELGKRLLKATPKSAGVHVNLMDAYFKARDGDPAYFEKSTEHARLAMLYGHNTGYVQKRLAINLEKLGKIHQAIQICDIVLMEKFHFSRHGCGTKEEFIKRKAALEKKITKAIDKENRTIFNETEIISILEQIRIEEVREEKERIAYEKR